MGGALQAEYAADLVFQVSLIREVEELLVVAENDKVRGLDAHLGHVIDLQAAALIRGRLHPVWASAKTELSMPVVMRVEAWLFT